MAWYNDIDTSKKFPLRHRQRDVAGNEYIYLKGVTSCASGSWVHYDSAGAATLSVADLQGPMAVANAAVDASTKYGWFTVFGVATGLCLASFDGTNGAGVWLTSTAGSVDDADVAGDAVIGAIGQTDRDTTTGTSSFIISYPFTVDGAID